MNKQMPNYSVLMSVYHGDRPEWLSESIDSILRQSTPTNDFVIICDGPLNEELDEVLSYYEGRNECIRIYRLPYNTGLGNALSIGIKNCKNELIARMDADDISLPERMEKQLVFHCEKHFDLVGSEILEFVGDSEAPHSIRKVPESNQEIYRYLKLRNPVNHVSVMFRKSSVLSAGNYLSMPFREDYYLWLRMLKNGAVFYNIQEPLVLVRAGDGMYKRRSGRQMRNSCFKMAKYMLNCKLINPLEYLIILSIWIGGASLPICIRKAIYKLSLRSKVQ